MAVDHIRYDLLAQEALRGMVRTVLDDTAKKGLPGEHHFYIAFDTRASGVRIPPRLLAQFPEEMTIVLQHQFWDLTVTEEAFEVGMSFGGIAERLVIPFAAINSFTDPSVPFGVKFERIGEAATDAPAPQTAATPGSETKPARPPAEHKRAPIAAVPKAADAKAETPSDDGPDKPAGGGEVVRLDRFRKK